MWREMSKIVIKLVLLAIPFFVILPLYCFFCKENYLDGEYAMYHQQRDYLLKNKDNNEVLILGDSRTKADFDPIILGDGVYNISLGGATPVEGYYSLKEYLSNHEAPKTLILAYAPMHYMDVDTFWSRTIYFHNITAQDALEVFKTAKQYQKTEKVFIKQYPIEYMMHYFYFPNKYAVAIKRSAFSSRKEENNKKYRQMEMTLGHTFYGVQDGSTDFCGEAKVEDFQSSDLIDHYLDQIFVLAKEYHISVIMEQTPINESSHAIITKDFKKNYRTYLANLQVKYPEVNVYPDFYWYENRFFGDADHLNQNGCKEYSEYIKNKYPDIFE